MQKKVLYIDFDSTIANAEKSICKIYNEKYKDHEEFTEAKWREVKDWTFKYTCTLITKLYENPSEKIAELFGSDEFFNNLTLYMDAERVLKKLNEVHDVIICTSATPANASRKVLWIEENIPYISEVIVVINTGSNGVGKGRIHMIENNSVFIDDHPENLISTKAKEKYLFKYKDTLFNQNWDGKVVSSWLEIEKIFCEESES
ncbi:5' nucleotidase, NT5C type [Helicovermis profundi]|uniref:Uncharacterized protein n=1 Tax=Helicovermis profundi TaxID=3065157 RepID=A0AAU9EBH3_9FIRM|nr:hypothetical protein HLPR_10000 [Clostridia bacterium S502]